MKRKQFLKILGLTPLAPIVMNLTDLEKASQSFGTSKKMPVLFIGHGHPMNALFDNSFTQRLHKLGEELETPNAILMISAHWETSGTYVSTNALPSTIYDFGGFDQRLFEIKYEPKGHPELAQEVKNLVKSDTVLEDKQMGLDHGAWTVLMHIFPDANIPVFQMSINFQKSPEFHYQLGKELAALRKKGVLIMGSGNIVHNLRKMDWNDINATPLDWNLEFDNLVKNHIDSRNMQELINFQNMGEIARLSIPTSDHYLPMLYTLGLVEKDDEIEHIYEGYQYASLSMRCFKIG